MADGFLGRWSRRKLDVKEGRQVPPEPALPQAAPPEPANGGASEALAKTPPVQPDEPGADVAPAAPEAPPSLEDVRALTPDADFSRFVRADVPADVKNAAMKKLFSDPHYNVMDRLDVYIDDYGKSDPIPAAMLRQLAAGRFLGLFREEEEKDELAGGARDDAEQQEPGSVAQSQAPAGPDPAAPPEAVPPHAHPDLRLQQDDAARPGETGRGTG